jgi:hypothetical protein
MIGKHGSQEPKRNGEETMIRRICGDELFLGFPLPFAVCRSLENPCKLRG